MEPACAMRAKRRAGDRREIGGVAGGDRDRLGSRPILRLSTAAQVRLPVHQNWAAHDCAGFPPTPAPASARATFSGVVRNCAAVYGVIPPHAGPTLPLPGFRRAGYASVGGLPTDLSALDSRALFFFFASSRCGVPTGVTSAPTRAAAARAGEPKRRARRSK
jgi:hypothetical protein